MGQKVHPNGIRPHCKTMELYRLRTPKEFRRQPSTAILKYVSTRRMNWLKAFVYLVSLSSVRLLSHPCDYYSPPPRPASLSREE